MPIFIPRIFVVHIRIFDRFLFPEKGFIVLEIKSVWVGRLSVQILCLIKDQMIVQLESCEMFVMKMVTKLDEMVV